MTVWEEIADRLKGVAAAPGAGPRLGLLRFRVTRVDPLTLDQVDGDEVLEDGDDDFTIGDSVRIYHADHGLEVGDIVRVLDDGDEFLATEVVSGKDFS